MRACALVLALGAATGCTREDPVAAPRNAAEAASPPAKAPRNTPTQGASAAAPAATPPLPACEGLGFSFEVQGLSQQQVRERFGAPARQEEYRAEERGGEFYLAIEHTYPQSDPANHEVPIQEWTWTSGDCILTVWFHRPGDAWVALYDIYRSKDVEF